MRVDPASEQTVLPRPSLTFNTLVNMALRLLLVILLISGISYWHLMSQLAHDTQAQLLGYIAERGQREEAVFVLAEDDHALLHDDFLKQWATLDAPGWQKRFEQHFFRWSDGSVRNAPEGGPGQTVDTERYPTVFLQPGVELTADLQQRLELAYELVERYGAGWRDRFVDTYITLPEGGMIMFWPGEAWGLDAQASLNIPAQEWSYLGDRAHNPERINRWTGVYADPVVQAWMVSAETPIDDAQGRHLATIGHDMILTDLLDRTIADHLEGTYNLLLRTDGQLIAEPHLMAQIQAEAGKLTVQAADDPHLARLFAFAQQTSISHDVVYNRSDQEYLAIARLSGPDWYLITVYPEQLLQAQALSNTWFLLGLGLTSLSLEVLLLWWVLQRQIKIPLEAVLGATQQVTAGDFGVELDTQRPDELGQLGIAFTQMTQQLQSAFTDLEQTIVQQQQAEAASRKIQDRLTFLVQHNPIGIIEWSTEFKVVGWNPAAETIFRYPAAQMLGRHALEIVPEPDRPHVAAVLGAIAQETGGQYSVNQNLRSDGARITCEWFNTPLRDAENQVIGIFSMVRDISDRLRNQDAITRKSQELEQALKVSQSSQTQLQASQLFLQKQAAALFQLTQNQAISEGKIAAAFQELTEITAELLTVERVSIWLADAEYSKIQCADLFKRSETRHSQGLELRAKDYPNYFKAVMSMPTLAANDAATDPRTREFRQGYLDVFNIVSMLDSCIYVNGEIRGVICCEQVGELRTWRPSEEIFLRSITNLTALTLEAAQRQANAQELEQALWDLKHTQLQMIQGEKMASLGNLVAGVAHEINNPIGFLQGNIQPAQCYAQDLLDLIDFLLQKCPDDDPVIQDKLVDVELGFIREDLPKLLSSMNFGVERIRTISNSLRTFARKDKDHKTAFNLHDGIESTLLILKHRMKANGQRPKIKVMKQYDSLPEVQCYPGQLNQVFMNILANAIDAFDAVNQGKTYQEIVTHPNQIVIKTSRPNETIQIQIQDNGCGMLPETVERIFEQGFTTKDVGKGTGLGMAIAHQIITEKHGGMITCTSTLGKGTTFTITLPLSDS
ncbi:MAG: ATP-binding protein [Cyanobacteria bacterium P01_G01_bin.54]